MSILAAVAAGLAGAAVALLLLYVASVLGLATMDVLRLLGSWLGAEPPRAVVAGLALAFALGAGYAVLYAGLWALGLGRPTWYWGLVYGAVHSALALRVASAIIARGHPAPAQVPFLAKRMVSVWILHLPYAVVVAVIYGLL